METATTANRFAGRTRRHRGATIGAAHDLGDPEAIIVPVDGLHHATRATALPWPDADLISHRSSRRAGAGPAQQARKLGVTLAFGGFERGSRAPLADVEAGARRNQQPRDLDPSADGRFDEWRSPAGRCQVGTSTRRDEHAHRIQMPGSHGLDERTVAIAVTLVGIGAEVQERAELRHIAIARGLLERRVRRGRSARRLTQGRSDDDKCRQSRPHEADKHWVRFHGDSIPACCRSVKVQRQVRRQSAPARQTENDDAIYSFLVAKCLPTSGNRALCGHIVSGPSLTARAQLWFASIYGKAPRPPWALPKDGGWVYSESDLEVQKEIPA